ncbi:MAG: Asp-tRNA(Asn)/Glu-tRNA(Gln) amidotransferase subunit GatC [Firmicutes bacterium]|nr:Asp-tRNA(Asn)/Glu-tRNA(Gln) amidotransferase subunit GatC [Bacillota bacterium]
MKVTREDVLRCARLTNLSLTEAEIEPMRQDMETLLSHAESLDSLDLDGVEPMYQGLPLALPRREDVPRPGLSQAEALANAPEAERGYFKVPKVL